MIARFISRTLFVAVLAGFALAPAAQAQQKPSPAAIALARQIAEVKGGLTMFDPVVAGVVQHHTNLLAQGNPTATSDLNAYAKELYKELQPRVSEVHDQIARAYAEQFTVAELKELLAFYKSPLGQKVVEGEPKALDVATERVEAWAEKLAGEVTEKIRAEMKKRGHNLL